MESEEETEKFPESEIPVSSKEGLSAISNSCSSTECKTFKP